MQKQSSDSPPANLISTCQPAPAEHDVRRAMWQVEYERDAFRRAFDDAGIGMALVDLDGRYVHVNNSLCEMVGRTPAEMLELTFQELTHPEDLDPNLAVAYRALAGELNSYHLEKRYLHKNGSVVWGLLSTSLIRDVEGRPSYFVSQMQNITARKDAEQESALRLRDMQRLTHTANQLLRAFETGEDEVVYAEVLQIALAAFESKAGLFLRFDNEGSLVGPYRGAGAVFTPRCSPDSCDLWAKVIEQRQVIAENAPRMMGCGLTVARSLAGPILYNEQVLGIVHLGDAAHNYTQSECDLLTRVLQLTAPALYARMRLESLTTREVEVMDMIVMGLTQKQIATALDVSVQTVAKHRARVLEKLSVRGDVDLVYFALKKRSNRLFDPAMVSGHSSLLNGVLPPPLHPEDGLSLLPKLREQ